MSWKESEIKHYTAELLADKLFPLSVIEIMNPAYGLHTKQARHTFGGEKVWWLRSAKNNLEEGCVDTDGGLWMHASNIPHNAYYAFNLNLGAVLFASDASDGSGKATAATAGSGTTALALADTNQWKLTLTDSSKKLEDASVKKNDGGGLSLDYSGASYGDNTYLSAILVDNDDDTIRWYGKLKELSNSDDASGSIALSLPGKLTTGSKLQVFVETVADVQTGTDYASATIIIDLPNKDPVPAAPQYLTTYSTTTQGGSDGKILGTTAAMEYSMWSDFTDAQPCGEGETTGLVANTYYVRFAETVTTQASTYTTVIVSEPNMNCSLWNNILDVMLSNPAMASHLFVAEYDIETGMLLSIQHKVPTELTTSFQVDEEKEVKCFFLDDKYVPLSSAWSNK